jgi:RNase adaptor protein for sRNA GlmZ degradation
MSMMDKAMGVMMGRMPKMMTRMMPHCLKIMLPKIAKEKRIEFVLKLVETGMQHGSVGMSEEEREDFVAKVVERAKG